MSTHVRSSIYDASLKLLGMLKNNDKSTYKVSMVDIYRRPRGWNQAPQKGEFSLEERSDHWFRKTFSSQPYTIIATRRQHEVNKHTKASKQSRTTILSFENRFAWGGGGGGEVLNVYCDWSIYQNRSNEYTVASLKNIRHYCTCSGEAINSLLTM